MIQCVYGHNAFREKGAGLLNALYMVVLGYGIKNFAFMKIKGFKALSIYITMAVLAGVLSIIEKKYLHMDDAHSAYYNSPFIVIASVAFFGFVTSLNVKWKFFSTIAPFVLAVYLRRYNGVGVLLLLFHAHFHQQKGLKSNNLF